MRKIWSSLGLAVLGIALLMGICAAEDAAVSGCVLPSANTVVIKTAPDAIVPLGVLPQSDIAGGSVVILSNATTGNNWYVTVLGNNAGCMSDGTHTLEQALRVKGQPATPISLTASAQSILTGTGPSADCAGTTQTIAYTQKLNNADNAHAGEYTITVTYAATLTAP